MGRQAHIAGSGLFGYFFFEPNCAPQCTDMAFDLVGWETTPMASTTDENETVGSDDAKERFRKALDAKNAKSNRGQSGDTQDAKAQKGSSSREGGQREFRRKSG